MPMSPVAVFSGVLYCCFGVFCGLWFWRWLGFWCAILFVVGGLPGLICGCEVGFVVLVCGGFWMVCLGL